MIFINAALRCYVMRLPTLRIQFFKLVSRACKIIIILLVRREKFLNDTPNFFFALVFGFTTFTSVIIHCTLVSHYLYYIGQNQSQQYMHFGGMVL